MKTLRKNIKQDYAIIRASKLGNRIVIDEVCDATGFEE